MLAVKEYTDEIAKVF